MKVLVYLKKAHRGDELLWQVIDTAAAYGTILAYETQRLLSQNEQECASVLQEIILYSN
jgi:hypothetical protein